MRIHTDTLTYRDFFDALDTVKARTGAPVMFHGAETLPRHGSRSRRQSYDVKLASNGTLTRRRVNYGTARYADRFDRPFSATWEQWGWLLSHLFAVDPDMIVGSPGRPVYAGVEDFDRQTEGKFSSATAAA